MGNSLDKPKMEKPHSHSLTMTENGFKIEAGITGMQGYRKEMEDQHMHVCMDSAPDHMFLGVFDGHGGKGCAIYVCGTEEGRDKATQKSLPEVLESTQEWKDYLASSPRSLDLLKKALTESFMLIDRQMQQYVLDNPYKAYSFGGATAVTVMITPDWIVCANAGDSRATMSYVGDIIVPPSTSEYKSVTSIFDRGYVKEQKSILLEPIACVGNDPTTGKPYNPRTLSVDHKPDNELERDRIIKAGGIVQNRRVDGNLAVSRGLGDFEFKYDKNFKQEEQKVSCVPDFYHFPRDRDNEEMIILACDGLWDVFSNDEAVQLVRKIWSEGETNIELVAEEMIDKALFAGSEDNISCIVVKLKGAVVNEQGGGVDARRAERPHRGFEGKEYDLLWCASKNDVPMVEKCIEKEQYDRDEEDRTTRRTAIHTAAAQGFSELAKVLIEKYDVRLNKFDREGMFPIHLAAKNGHKDIVELILNREPSMINPSTVGTRGNDSSNGAFSVSLIDLALQGGHADVVAFLQEFQKNNDSRQASSP